MRLQVQANCDWQKVNERRQRVESLRQNKIVRLRTDIDKIVKREVEYAKNVVDIIIPFKVTWNQEAWNRVKEFIPVSVEAKDEAESVDIVLSASDKDTSQSL